MAKQGKTSIIREAQRGGFGLPVVWLGILSEIRITISIPLITQTMFSVGSLQSLYIEQIETYRNDGLGR